MKIDLTGTEWPTGSLGADAVEKTSEQVRAVYIELISRMSQDRKGDIDWWVTSLASRNTYVCPLYKHLCQLVFIKTLYEKGEAPSEIVTDSHALSVVFKKMLGTSVTITVVGRQGCCSVAIYNFIRHYTSAFYHVTAQYICSSLWLKKRNLPSHQAVLIDLFLSVNSFSENGIIDRYYPDMLNTLDPVDRENVLYIPIHYRVRNYFSYFKKINRCRNKLLLKEDVLNLADYVYALLHPFRLRWPAKQIDFMGIDIGGVVREAFFETFSNSSSIEGILRYRFAKRLSMQAFKPRLIVEWFENQEVDHGAVAGWREFFPAVEVIGYQGFLASPHYLSMFPTKQEQTFALLPTKIAVIGPSLVEAAKEFAPDLDVINAPAFRFSSVWLEKPDKKNKQQFSVLVSLPIHFTESFKILSMVKAMLFQINQGVTLQILIKPHPSWLSSDIERIRNLGVKEFELVDGVFENVLKQSDLVISAASSTCAYAIAMAVPCIVIGQAGQLLDNPINKQVDKILWRTCYTVDELCDALLSSVNSSENDSRLIKEAADKFRKRQFNPVTKQAVYEFIGLSYTRTR